MSHQPKIPTEKFSMETRRSFLKKTALAASTAALPALSSCMTINTVKADGPMRSGKIKTIAVLWYSQTGNTQKCGTVLAKHFGDKGFAVISGDLDSFDKTQLPNIDLLVMGTPVFYYDTPDYAKEFIQSLPALKGIPVAAYVTFGGPEGNQHNAACTILEELVHKNGVPVGLNAFMGISSYPLTFESEAERTDQTPLPPNQATYKNVQAYGDFILSQVKKAAPSEFKKTLTLREFSTYFNPMWWNKLVISDHHIIKENCVQCMTCIEKCPSDSIDLDTFSVNTDTCVLCFGCINNCDYQAVNMIYNGKAVTGFNTYIRRKT